MTIKLLVTSLMGVGALGGAVATAIHILKPKATESSNEKSNQPTANGKVTQAVKPDTTNSLSPTSPTSQGTGEQNTSPRDTTTQTEHSS